MTPTRRTWGRSAAGRGRRARAIAAPRRGGSAPGPPVALITGATRGLGRSVARELVLRGFRIVTCSTSATPPGLGETLHRRLDVGDPAAVNALVRAVARRVGRIDVLVNNAGFANPPSPLLRTREEIVRRCFGTNALGPYAFLRRVVPIMLAQREGGVVVNVASRAALVPVPGLAAYSASKSALLSLTLAAAKELEGDRVACFAVCPGGMATGMRSALYGARDSRRQLDPSTVADVVVELATARSVGGRRVRSGSAILITRESGVRLLEWPEDERGHRSFLLR
jgi:NAD(P)-dependent dehydrogenase (short-subunit alcohol dehydrogenase family)